MSEQQATNFNPETKTQPEEKSYWQIDRDNKVVAIQAAALNTNLSNGVKRELTFQQAYSILIRSKSLSREAVFRPCEITNEELRAQTEECYRQRRNQRG